MHIYSLDTLIDIARQHSPFYRNLYRGLNTASPRLTDLPLVPSKDFWHANTLTNNQVLTSNKLSGTVFKSGGTTGEAKLSYYTHEEWETFCALFGQGLAKGGLGDFERIANLFYAGDLYASFLFITRAIELSGKSAAQFPISGTTDNASILKCIQDFEIETLVGLPTSMLSLLDYADIHTPQQRLPVTKILFGGEALQTGQADYIRSRLSGVHIQSVGYASVDAGLLGYATQACRSGEHYVFDKASVIEILDEDTQEPITELHTPGKVYITNLTRALMPIIRYPAGDRAMWVSSPHQANPRFKLLGRSDEGARIGPVTVYTADIENLLAEFRQEFGISDFQLKVVHEQNKDGLIMNLVSPKSRGLKRDPSHLLDAFYQRRPAYHSLSCEGRILPAKITWIGTEELVRNRRTGKMLKVVDLRSGH